MRFSTMVKACRRICNKPLPTFTALLQIMFAVERSILSPLNVTVHELNKNIPVLISVEHTHDQKAYLSIDINNSDDGNYPIEYLNRTRQRCNGKYFL